MTTALGKPTRVQLSNVPYAQHLEKNIISYGLLEFKGYVQSTGGADSSASDSPSDESDVRKIASTKGRILERSHLWIHLEKAAHFEIFLPELKSRELREQDYVTAVADQVIARMKN
ncbi:uncharacterized protein PITG_22303 [Phytophthora infestans T30-4]|uniref:Uncharacterized protein n=1 Tax=Phytophthora infestans (strain T30-4) TaxID=403677 RepID=D0RM44_PHYIT|nr:uncharacterized protein PITG_22303 [Phytophthora infestans T30-4]EEY59050.1 hypothetical protein PITG_22303 [Phytophthora infestans T30-4]KAI9998617.1 hypothetical protein PInf_003199 [Phytophthora infestans]|eukprot:XP_002909886.1 hypothetical protein PITG_22303 [Phytophthora infestans T30-4]